MPSTGPGSAWFNPAALSETRLAYALAGSFSSVSGKSSRAFWDLSATLPPGLAPWLPLGVSGGLAREAAAGSVDNSNAVYAETVYRPALALAYPSSGQRPFRLAAGMAIPLYTHDVFRAVKSTSGALDIGLLGTLEEGGLGRFRLGFTWHSLVKPEVKLPDGRGQYTLPGWRVTSFGYSTPGAGARIHWEHYFQDSKPATEGPDGESSQGMNAFEVEVKPVSWMGIQAEVTRGASNSSLGVVFYPVYPVFGSWPVGFRLEANIGHDRVNMPGLGWLLGPPQDEGLGYLLGLTLGAGI